MSLSHMYQDFGRHDFDLPTNLAEADEGLEDLKLSLYEDGYKAGWDDSIKARGAEVENAISQIAQRLEDFSFTHAEAVSKMNAAVQPVLQKITTSLLPDVAVPALGAQVIEQLEALVVAQAEGAIEIAVAPENITTLNSLLEGRVSTPFRFFPDPTLSPAQVYLRTKHAEREINLDVVREGIAAALDAYFTQTLQEDMHHG